MEFTKTTEWTISSGDTSVRFGILDQNALVIYSVINQKNNSEWIAEPSVLPLMNQVDINGVHTDITWTFVQDHLETQNGETTLTLTFKCNELDISMDSIWWAGISGAVKHSIYCTNNESSAITVFYQPTMNVKLDCGNAESLRLFTIYRGGGTPGDIGIENIIIKDSCHERIDSNKIPIAFVNRDSNEGIYIAHEFGTGEIIVSGSKTDKAKAIVQSGLGTDFKTDVPAGATFYIPVSFVGTYIGDQDAAANTLNRWLWDYGVPYFLKEEKMWPHVILNVWNSVGGGNPSAENFYRTVDEAKKIGFDRIVLDYGWWERLGEWNASNIRWPENITPVGKYIVDHGMDFVLYFLFHSIGSEQDDALSPTGPNAHPEWLVNNGNAEYEYADLGNSECVTFLKKKLEQKMKEYSASGYRSDFSPVQPNSVQKNRHMYGVDTEYWNWVGFYEILDYLKEKIEHFSYENCCGGGHYKDFATMKRTANIFSTDTYRPLDARRTFYDATYVYPPCQIAPQVVFADDNPFFWDSFEKRKLMTPGYIYRSVMMGAMYINFDIPIWAIEPTERSFVERQVEIYKQWIRPLVMNANIYHITDRPDDIHWDAMEYYDLNTGKGIVYVFRPRSESEAEILKLKGLELNASYEIKSEDRQTTCILTGKELMEDGIQVYLKQKYDADLLYIMKI